MSLHREFVLRRALRKLRQDPEACLNPKNTVVAERAGVALYALAHIETWGERVRNIAAHLRIRNVHIIAAPLRDYGDYSWYSPPPELLRRKFSLVLCDAPPGDTRGGRYRLIPTVRNSLHNRCIIPLDDAIRGEEQATAIRWQNEIQLRCEKVGATAPYFRLTMCDPTLLIAR